RVAATWLCAFAPVLGWRYGYGHLGFVTASLPLLAGAALLVAANRRRLTPTLVAASAAAFVLALTTTGQQVLLGALVFASPWLLVLWLAPGASARAALAAGGVAAGSAAIAWPWFSPLLAHALGPDTPRQVGAASVVYDYVVVTARDWMASL